MKRITVSVDEDTDLFFRKFASQRFKFERGWYSKAVNKAMKLWINYEKSKNENLLVNSSQLWFNHGISFIPHDIMMQAGDLSNFELVEAECDDLNKTHELHTKIILSAKKIKGLSPIFHSDYVKNFNKVLNKGVNVKLILTESVLEKTVEGHNLEGLENIKSLILEDQLELYKIEEEVKVAFTVTDEAITLGFFTINGTYDTTRVLVSNHESMLQWGDKLFEYYLERAQKIDLEIS